MIEQLDRLIPTLLARTGVAGLSLALIAEGQTVWRQGFGVADRATGWPVTTETVFQAASLSKPVFAYAVCKLCTEGMLNLDRPLSTYLPAPYIPDDPRVHAITARHVLSHTSGFPNWRNEGEPLRIYFTPGLRFSYSGEGYVYLQRGAEQVTEQPAADYLRHHLLEPLGMHNSSYIWLDRYEKEAARGHAENGEPAAPQKWTEMNAAYSLLTTPGDFAHLVCAMMQPRPAAALDRASVAEMLTPQVRVNDDAASWHAGWPQAQVAENRELSWGLGWGLQHTAEGDTFWHWGANPNFKSFVVASLAKQSGIVLMANSEQGASLWREILAVVFPGPHPALDWIASL